MTGYSTPWDEIRKPVVDMTVRLVDSDNAVPLYWGRDTDGRCLFIVELTGNHVERFKQTRTQVYGISSDLRQMPVQERQWLILSLELSVDKDLFYGLCRTLVTNLEEVKDSNTALEVTMTHIRRWKAFLAGRHRRLLTSEEIRGLFCELHFLQWLYSGPLSQEEALMAWLGPDYSHQDFIFDNTAVEIKCASPRDRSTVRISSEDQLESVCDRLYLAIYRLTASTAERVSLSLNDKVRMLAAEMRTAEARELFDKQTAAYGYVEMTEYDNPKFSVTSQQMYRVTDGFPRIIRSALISGVTRVQYEIELDKIRGYSCEFNDIRE